MLAIRLQRKGRKGLAQYRLIAQEAERSPSSGRVVAYLGHYNPHTKEVVVDKEKAEMYLKNGAQPSGRAVGLLKDQGIKMPKWVQDSSKQSRDTRNPEKLRKNQPKEETPVVSEEAKPEHATDEQAEVAADTDISEEKVEKPQAEESESAKKE